MLSLVPSAAAIYCRISSDPTGAGLGVKRQEADCRAWAERRGWPVAALYVDDDTSAYRGKPRRAYQSLIEAIKTGAVDAVIVYHLDRLHRHPKELEEFLDVCDEAGVKDLATVTGDIDLATHDGRFHARILGAVAKKESDDKSRRLKRKHLELAEQGKLVGGGTRPFGFEADRVTLRADEAALIREAAQRVLAGETLTAIALDWTRRGIPTVTGTETGWSVTVVRRILTSGRSCGWREHHGVLTAASQSPAILDRNDVDRLRRILLDPARMRNHLGPARRYLLTGGVARCGVCGVALIARPKDGGRRAYKCATGPGLRGCGRIAILAEPFEGWVVQSMFGVVSSPALREAVEQYRSETEMNESDAAATLAEIEQQLAELAEDWARRDISRGEWTAARRILSAQADAERRRLHSYGGAAELGDYAGREGALEAAWDVLDFGRRRAIVDALVDRVVVGSAVRGFNRFDPSRLDIVWRE